MYLINKEQNKITKLKERTFSELGFRERENLQEWIADNPNCLGEELLIIQKEFNGFPETKERLDLLALDKQGNLVIIENKLDDSGRDVTWQVIKYASYCSSLSKENIKEIFEDYLRQKNQIESVEDVLSEFFEGKDFEELTLNQGSTQRIVMIAGKFRKEVTSTVLWMMNYNIRIQCFRVTPFSLDDKLFLNLEQILPIKDTEEFSISMANKAKDEIETQQHSKSRHFIRSEFWSKYLIESNKKNILFSNISPSKDTWIGIGIGMSGVNLNLVATKKYCRSEIYFNRGSQDENKKCFDFIYGMRQEIERKFGDGLIWERMDEKVSCRIKHEISGVSIFEKEEWNDMINFLVDSAERMANTFKEPVRKLNIETKNNEW